MKSTKYLGFALALGSLTGMSGLAGAQMAKTHRLTGYIGDSKCGAKNHDAACVKKCISGGAQAVFVDSHKKVWAIDNTDAVTNYEGDKVKVRATVDAANNSIHIDKVMSHSSAGGM